MFLSNKIKILLIHEERRACDGLVSRGSWVALPVAVGRVDGKQSGICRSLFLFSLFKRDRAEEEEASA